MMGFLVWGGSVYGQSCDSQSTDWSCTQAQEDYQECVGTKTDSIELAYCKCKTDTPSNNCKEKRELELCKRDRFGGIPTPQEDKLCSCIAYGGIELNTDVPFIGRCIAKSDTSKSVPLVVWGLGKILMSLILVGCFIALIVAGVIIAGGETLWGPKKWMSIIRSVVMALALLGSLGIILRLINPNFFK